MSGVAVIRTLLAGSANLTAVVPATRIKAGDLPLNTALPAISVLQVSDVIHNGIKTNDTNKMHTTRVQVTVYVKDDDTSSGYTKIQTIMPLILAACPSQRATVASTAVDSISPQGEGPDLSIPDFQIMTRSMDFMVRYTA